MLSSLLGPNKKPNSQRGSAQSKAAIEEVAEVKWDVPDSSGGPSPYTFIYEYVNIYI